MSHTKIYLAGKFHDERMPARMQALRERGFQITHDWTIDKDAPLKEAAILDINGVRDCDVVLAVMDDESYSYRGTFAEIGCAIGLNKRILVVNANPGTECTNLCFYHHPQIEHCGSFEEACEKASK